MSRILVIHGESAPREFIEERAKRHHDAVSVRSIGEALGAIANVQPDLMIANLSLKKPEALELLRHIRRNGTPIPVLLVGEPAAAVLQPVAAKLGASGFIEFPMEQEALDRAITKVLQKHKEDQGKIPDISAEELRANISVLETDLNRRMECFAGRNQVYIQSLILGQGRTSKPRIALKCALRKKFGYKPDVYYEFIRDVCCNDPSACPAHQEFQSRHSA